jgi:hypothetical protein
MALRANPQKPFTPPSKGATSHENGHEAGRGHPGSRGLETPRARGALENRIFKRQPIQAHLF